MRVLPLVVLFVAIAACDRVVVKPTVDAGPVCADGENLVHGTCRFVCNRDGECPSGERCNLLLGSCEARSDVPDSGSPPIPCTRGAVRCAADNLAVQTCSAEGLFETSEVCVAPDGYCENEHCLACRPGARRCTQAGAEVCTDTGSAWRPITCAAGSTCVSGECVECTVGQRRCSASGTTLEECQRLPREDLSAGFVPAGDNFDGTCVTQVCETGANGAQCRTPACLPGATRCASASTQEVCSATGAWAGTVCTTLPGMGPTAECLNGTCVDECAEALAAKSYFGCEYWSAIPDNSVDPLFKGLRNGGVGVGDSDFVYVVTNQSIAPATVQVWRHNGTAASVLKTVTVPGRNDPATRGLVKIPVPWRSISPTTTGVGMAETGRARIAYRLTSTKPVTVYQFNPVDAVKVTSKACTASVGSIDCACNEAAEFTCDLTVFGSCVSCSGMVGTCSQQSAGKRCSYGTFSNDASLLLPAHILGDSYVTLTPGHVHQSIPTGPQQGEYAYSSTYSVVAPADNTQVTVKSSAVTKASISGTPVTAMAVGETRVFTLQSYEVLQFASATAGSNVQCTGSLCRKSNDLTGSIVTSDKPVAVFGSSPCLNVPFDRAYCDHVEEQMFPFATWGKNFVAVPSAPLRLNNNNFATNPPPDHFKIVAGATTTLTLTPPPSAADVLQPFNCSSGSLPSNTCVLAGGSFVEFKSTRAFTVSSTNPIAVAQFFPGQGTVTGAPSDPQQGDPSMVLLPPVEQWRARYTVLASTGLKDNYLGLTIDGTRVQQVLVDGVAVTGFAAITGSSFQSKNHPVSTGTHTIQVIAQPNQQTVPGAGVTVYGYDGQVSYGYTGGLDLTTIVTGVNPGG